MSTLLRTFQQPEAPIDAAEIASSLWDDILIVHVTPAHSKLLCYLAPTPFENSLSWSLGTLTDLASESPQQWDRLDRTPQPFKHSSGRRSVSNLEAAQHVVDLLDELAKLLHALALQLKTEH